MIAFKTTHDRHLTSVHWPTHRCMGSRTKVDLDTGTNRGVGLKTERFINTAVSDSIVDNVNKPYNKKLIGHNSEWTALIFGGRVKMKSQWSLRAQICNYQSLFSLFVWILLHLLNYLRFIVKDLPYFHRRQQVLTITIIFLNKLISGLASKAVELAVSLDHWTLDQTLAM